MRVFHTLVFDDNLEGTATTLYSDPSHNAMLGLVEKLTLFAVSDTVSVTGTLAVQIEESGDQVRWTTKVANPELTQTLSTSAVNVGVARDAGANPSSGFVRLKVFLAGGSTADAHVRVWVTGRGEQVMQ